MNQKGGVGKEHDRRESGRGSGRPGQTRPGRRRRSARQRDDRLRHRQSAAEARLLSRAAAGSPDRRRRSCRREIDALQLVPATINLAGAEIELVSALSRETRLRQALAPIRARYDFILIDCPPSLGLLTINALTAADDCIIPVQAEFYALEGLSQLTHVIRRVREALNPTLHVSGVLVTMFDGRTRLATEVIEELERSFPSRCSRRKSRAMCGISEAPSYGKPVILFDVKSRGAQAYLALARECSNRSAYARERAATRPRARSRRAAGRHAPVPSSAAQDAAARNSGRRDHAQPVPAAQDLRRSRPRRTQASIAEYGVLVPIIVRRRDDGLRTRRRRAPLARLRGAAARDDSGDRPRRATTATRSKSRSSRTCSARISIALEEAAGFEHLIDEYGFTQEDVARRLGKSRPTIANALRLLSLPDAIKAMLVAGQLSAGHGKALLLARRRATAWRSPAARSTKL